MKTLKLFVEGGGDSKSLRTECRAAFCAFLHKAGLSGYMPRIVASGSRNAAYSDYCTAINAGENAMLLVDSEAEVVLQDHDTDFDSENPHSWNPWRHLVLRMGKTGLSADSWEKPSGAINSDCHLMVQSMESWFLADVSALKGYFGAGFSENSLPKRKDIENISKETVLASLRAATQDTGKGRYDKGNHSFDILKSIDPHRIISQSPWAKRFVVLISEKMRGIR